MRVLEQVEWLTLLQELARLVLDVDESIGHTPNQLLRLFDGKLTAHDVFDGILNGRQDVDGLKYRSGASGTSARGLSAQCIRYM